jgi:glycosyltransferase involved in cell wall biosynthesis
VELLAAAGLATSAEVEIVPNPIDPAEVLADTARTTKGRSLGYLGGASRRKGFHLLPEIITRLGPAIEEITVVAEERPGQGLDPEWKRLRALPSPPVRIVGKMDDVRPFYARCDVLLVPSLEESFGRVAVEAMLNGVPVVASDIPALRQVVGGGGLLFPVGDAATAADRVVRILDDEGLRHEYELRGGEIAREYTPERVVARLLSAYRRPSTRT